MSPLSIEIQEVRMRSALRLVVFLVSSIVLLPVAARAQANIGFDIAWNHVALSVPNIAESIAWYEKMLGFKGAVRPGQPGARQQVAVFGVATSPSNYSRWRTQPRCRSRGRTRQKTSARTE